MKEPDFDSSSLEQPDVEPTPPAPERAPSLSSASASGDGEEDSTLEQFGGEEFYVRAGTTRRRPKYGVFGVFGGLIGLLIGLVLAQVGSIPADQDYTRLDLSIVLVGLGVPTGVLLALALALFLDRQRK